MPAKNHTAPGTTRGKLPEPRTLWLHIDLHGNEVQLWTLKTAMCPIYEDGDTIYPTAVIPLTTKPSAAKLCAIQKLLEMSEDELLRFVNADEMEKHWPSDYVCAQNNRVLEVLGLLPAVRTRKGK